jgi:hypothetical protein
MVLRITVDHLRALARMQLAPIARGHRLDVVRVREHHERRVIYRIQGEAIAQAPVTLLEVGVGSEAGGERLQQAWVQTAWWQVTTSASQQRRPGTVRLRPQHVVR